VPVSQRRIQTAKNSSRQYVVRLDEPVPVFINYDTLVVEGGVLHIYADVYSRSMNRPWRLLDELKSSGIDVSALDEKTAKRLLAKPTRNRQFVVETSSIEQGRALADGRLVPVLNSR
jgi:murein L,D-transpeptidase YcbB/YkuD